MGKTLLCNSVVAMRKEMKNMQALLIQCKYLLETMIQLIGRVKGKKWGFHTQVIKKKTKHNQKRATKDFVRELETRSKVTAIT